MILFCNTLLAIRSGCIYGSISFFFWIICQYSTGFHLNERMNKKTREKKAHIENVLVMGTKVVTHFISSFWVASLLVHVCVLVLFFGCFTRDFFLCRSNGRQSIRSMLCDLKSRRENGSKTLTRTCCHSYVRMFVCLFVLFVRSVGISNVVDRC